MKITPTALTTSDQYLKVLVTLEIAHAQHVYVIRIPWEWLLDEDVIAGMDREHRRRLLSNWSDVPLPLESTP